MYAKSIAITGAFAALVSAVPMAKRDVVWVTEIQEAVVTVPVTTTVWVDPTDVPTSHYGHSKAKSHKHTQTVQSTIIVRPTPAAPSSYEAPSSSSSAVEVAPASSVEESSTSVYVAPTPSSTYVAPSTYVEPSTYVAPTTSSSSVYVAPTTSTSVYVAPSPTSTYEAPSTYAAAASTSAAAPPAYSEPSSSSSSGSGLSSGMAASGTSYTGEFTYYAVGMGACGQTSSESDKMVAISEAIFDSYMGETGGNPNKNPVCGKKITITGADGSSYSAEVLDRCPGCAEGDLDFPQSFFNTVTSKNGQPADGRAHGMKWSWD